ncbi:2'-5' RNA ligase family protein [Kribbella solani]|uniref:2'-5' RNA ligase n=1 Tax=Kribbella solani TaxID=236067 RepID=A0A841E1I6_9ACTN|nr:2'-5' RNA ligase family protein [Kribbella solani]MBB5982865.1 2'-5' RNA ligase [Kribbella solani]MDX2971937.1 2'-5' RNA ligase family protein [Kribbella solani]MDX3000861.1 2'-5' RNA ligase family protein [Kribbella solani]
MSDELRDHWSWRPGWRPGRIFYTWHVTFEDHPEIAGLRAAYAGLLDELPGFTPVPVQWLHLAVQGVGFADRVPKADLLDIVDATRLRVSGFGAVPVTVGPAVLDPESIRLQVDPAEPLRHLRDLTRAAMVDIWGDDAVPELPGLDPHITLAYSNSQSPAAATATRLTAHPAHSAKVSITALRLLALTRSDHLYHWTTSRTLPLEPAP